jgi:hypothetical protein
MQKSRFVTSLAIFVAALVLSLIIDLRHFASLAMGTPSKNIPAQASQASTQKWEYRALTKDIRDKKTDLDNDLNQLGGQGFEVFSMTQSTLGDCCNAYVTILLRRPKQ